MTVTAVIVARGGSKRLPNKALLPFAGRTLIAHKVRQLMAADMVDRVVVGSDSEAILNAASMEGAETVLRDAFHCDESKCTANEMIRDMASKVSGDVIVWAHPTNPLVTAKWYDDAVNAYQSALANGYDSLASVMPIKRHAWMDEKPFNYDPWANRHHVAAELPAINFQDGAIFIQPRQQMLDNAYFFGKHPYLFNIPQYVGWDIDTQTDYLLALTLAGANECI